MIMVLSIVEGIHEIVYNIGMCRLIAKSDNRIAGKRVDRKI